MRRSSDITRRIAAMVAAASLLGAHATAQRAASERPVVAVVATNGTLLPLATLSGDEWSMLPWPQHDHEDDSSPALPARIDPIPAEWMAPLSSLPTTWRLQPLNGDARRIGIRAGTTAVWNLALFDTVGLVTDYVDPDSRDRSWNFNAGVAVVGDIETLPTSTFHESSPEWRGVVARHAPEFFNAERSDARRAGARFKGHSPAATASELLKAEVSLYRVSAGSGRTYEYFEAIVTRPGDADSRRLNCPTQSVEYHGLIERHELHEEIRWISGVALSCGALTEGMEVVGGVRSRDRVWLVVEYSGDDWQEFAVVDPAGPESKIRRGLRGSG